MELRKILSPVSYTLLALAAAFLFFTYRLLGADSSLNIYPDNEMYLGPVFSFASDSIRHFSWPLRMDTLLGGLPLYDSPQISAGYPFYFLYLPVFESPLASIYSLHWITLLHVGILEVNTYILLRTLKLSRTSAIIGVIPAVFCIPILGLLKWTHVIASFAWLPLYLAGIIRVLESPASSRSGVMMTIAAFVLLAAALTGQALIFSGLFTFVFTLTYFKFHENRQYARSAALRLSGVLAIAACLAAPIILPVVADMPQMIRWVAAAVAVTGYHKIPFENFLTDQLSPGEIPSFLFNLGQRHEITNAYIGLFPIFLACLVVTTKARHWLVRPLLVLAIFSFFSSFGSNFGLAYLNYHLPLLNKIREPSYYLLIFNLSICILAAMGLDFLLRNRVQDIWSGIRDSRFISLGFILIVALSALLVILNHQLTLTTTIIPLLSLILLLAALYSIVQLKIASYEKAWKATFVALMLLVQFLNVQWTSPTISGSLYLSENWVAMEQAFAKIAELDPKREYRVVFGGEINKQAAAMLASYNGIRTLNAYVNPMPLEQFLQMYNHKPRADKYAKALGARFMLCKQCSPQDVDGYRLLETIAGYSIYTADDVLPKTYETNKLMGSYSSVEDYVLKVSQSDLRDKPIYIQPDDHGFNDLDAHVTLECNQKAEKGHPNDLVFVISCNAPSVLVVNEFFTNSWKAWLNGESVNVHKVNGNQLGIYIPKGAHSIELKYSPGIVGASYAVFLLGLIGIFFYFRFLGSAGHLHTGLTYAKNGI